MGLHVSYCDNSEVPEESAVQGAAKGSRGNTEILRKLCEHKEVEVVTGSIGVDHIHMCLKIPPKLAVSQFIGYLKEKSALMVFDRHSEMKGGNRHFWARGYFVSTVGIEEAVLNEYIKKQEEADIIEDKLTPSGVRLRIIEH